MSHFPLLLLPFESFGWMNFQAFSFSLFHSFFLLELKLLHFAQLDHVVEVGLELS